MCKFFNNYRGRPGGGSDPSIGALRLLLYRDVVVCNRGVFCSLWWESRYVGGAPTAVGQCFDYSRDPAPQRWSGTFVDILMSPVRCLP